MVKIDDGGQSMVTLEYVTPSVYMVYNKELGPSWLRV